MATRRPGPLAVANRGSQNFTPVLLESIGVTDNETTVADPPEIESTLIRYSIPVKGGVEIGASFSMHLDDLYLEFITNERKLCELIVVAPLPKEIPPVGDLPNQAGGSDELRLWEPRASEIEELVLNAANLLSTVRSILVEIQFDTRKIEWIHKRPGGYVLSGVTVEMAGRRKQPPVRVHPEIVSRAFITSRVFGTHDPSFTFYKRGMADTVEHRYIEAFYNFFFFLNLITFEESPDQEKSWTN